LNRRTVQNLHFYGEKMQRISDYTIDGRAPRELVIALRKYLLVGGRLDTLPPMFAGNFQLQGTFLCYREKPPKKRRKNGVFADKQLEEPLEQRLAERTIEPSRQGIHVEKVVHEETNTNVKNFKSIEQFEKEKEQVEEMLKSIGIPDFYVGMAIEVCKIMFTLKKETQIGISIVDNAESDGLQKIELELYVTGIKNSRLRITSKGVYLPSSLLVIDPSNPAARYLVPFVNFDNLKHDITVKINELMLVNPVYCTLRVYPRIPGGEMIMKTSTGYSGTIPGLPNYISLIRITHFSESTNEVIDEIKVDAIEAE